MQFDTISEKITAVEDQLTSIQQRFEGTASARLRAFPRSRGLIQPFKWAKPRAYTLKPAYMCVWANSPSNHSDSE
jgi:hypothetical protein